MMIYIVQYSNLKHCFWLVSSVAGALQMLLMLTARLDYLTILVAVIESLV